METPRVDEPHRLSLIELSAQWLDLLARSYYRDQAMEESAQVSIFLVNKALADLMELGADLVEDVTPELLRRWARTKFDLGLSESWIERTAGQLRHAFGFAVRRGYIASNPVEEYGPLVPIDPGGRPPAWLSQLSPVRQAEAIRDMMAARGCSGRAMGRHLGFSPATIVRALALLKLPEPIRGMVDRGELSPSIAIEIGKHGGRRTQARLVDLAVSGHLKRSHFRRSGGRTPEQVGPIPVATVPQPGDPAPADGPPAYVQSAGMPFFIAVRGADGGLYWQEKPAVSPERHAALALLTRAWPARVDRKTLEKPRPEGAGTGARGTLRAWKGEDEHMATMIDMAGRSRRGYGLLPADPTSTNLHKLPSTSARIIPVADGRLTLGERAGLAGNAP
jgi:hypothetical protein